MHTEHTERTELRTEDTRQNVRPDAEPEPVTVLPEVDIFESDAAFVLVADMPGLEPDAVEVQLDGERLTLGGVARIEGLEPRRYERTFRVMRGLEPDTISALYKDGVLTVTLARPAAPQPRRISVSAG